MHSLDQSLGFLMNTAAFAMKRKLEARLKKYGLTAPQFAVMARLMEQDKLSMSEMGNSLHLDKPTITGVIDRLERKKLVMRSRHDKDRRILLILLTSEGAGLREALRRLAVEVNEEALRGFTEEEGQMLKRLLAQIDIR